jgi:diketogulonate reductase-like aldo/keto reductase
MPVAPTYELNDGTRLPAIGFGTSPMDDAEAEVAVREALRLGYRLVDTAASYGNEVGVGRAVSGSEVPRSEVLITSKLRGADQGYESTLKACAETLDRLGTSYVDLYLIHWPLPRIDRYVDSWRAMIKLCDDGLVRSIGVSNFTAVHLDRLLDETGVAPSVNQLELHPFFPQSSMRVADDERHVLTQAWRPLGKRTNLLEVPAIADAAERLGRAPAQVVLRWHVQLGVVPVPKSATPARMAENLDVFDFELTPFEMDAIGGLPSKRLGGDPDTHEEF